MEHLRSLLTLQLTSLRKHLIANKLPDNLPESFQNCGIIKTGNKLPATLPESFQNLLDLRTNYNCASYASGNASGKLPEPSGTAIK